MGRLDINRFISQKNTTVGDIEGNFEPFCFSSALVGEEDNPLPNKLIEIIDPSCSGKYSINFKPHERKVIAIS